MTTEIVPLEILVKEIGLFDKQLGINWSREQIRHFSEFFMSGAFTSLFFFLEKHNFPLIIQQS